MLLQNDLVEKDLLKARGTFAKHGILLQKSLVAHVKGIRLKTEADLLNEYRLVKVKETQMAAIQSMTKQEDSVLNIAIPVGVKTVNGCIESINVRTLGYQITYPQGW